RDLIKSKSGATVLAGGTASRLETCSVMAIMIVLRGAFCESGGGQCNGPTVGLRRLSADHLVVVEEVAATFSGSCRVDTRAVERLCGWPRPRARFSRRQRPALEALVLCAAFNSGYKIAGDDRSAQQRPSPQRRRVAELTVAWA